MRLTATFLLSLTCLLGPGTHATLYEPPAATNTSIAFAQINVDGHALHYAYAGNKNELGVLFIHGTPGGWPAFEAYLENRSLQEDFFLISADRPGWGQSTIPQSTIDGDFALQAKSFARIMQQYPDKKWIIVGHSLGASMAPKVALQAPDQVSGVLLLAGSIDPQLGKPRWYHRLAHTWLAKRLLPTRLGNSNDEMMALQAQLELMSKELSETRLNARLIVIQGMRDFLVSPKNPDYAEKNWQDSFTDITLVTLSDEGHFLPWRQSPLVIEKIRELANRH